jgi:16S rRNA (uracil1498-N3)-methyltransferase
MNSFYVPELTVESKTIQLSEDESKHAVRVLRLKSSDQVHLLDGKGSRYLARITDDHPKRCSLEIESVDTEEEASPEIHIAISPTKSMDRIEWFLEKAVELGLTELSLLLCKNSERKQINVERLEKIAISAMKQSQRLYLPRINELQSFDSFLSNHPSGALAHCYSDEKITLSACFQPKNYPILIGPEGDFSNEEVEKAYLLGYDFITLGKNRLRTETAGLYVCMQALIESKI